jgi:hypothetical protein
MFKGKALKLADPHGGDWKHWRPGWKTRDIPKRFRTAARVKPQVAGKP